MHTAPEEYAIVVVRVYPCGYHTGAEYQLNRKFSGHTHTKRRAVIGSTPSPATGCHVTRKLDRRGHRALNVNH